MRPRQSPKSSINVGHFNHKSISPPRGQALMCPLELLTFSLMTVTVASATFMFTEGQSSLLDEVIRLSMALFRVSMPTQRKDN